MQKPTFYLICANFILSFVFQAQEITDVTPELGVNYVYRQLQINASDTGAVGINQVWNYSGKSEVSSTNYTSTYRVLTSSEVSDYPSANFVNEWSTPQSIYQTNYYVINIDSIALLGQVNSSSTTNYLNPLVEYYFPMNSVTNFIDTCDNLNSSTEPSIITNETVFQGSGTLSTPYGSYLNALKFKSVRKQFANNSTNPYYSSTFYFWLHPEYKTIIFRIYEYEGNVPGLSYSNLTLVDVGSASMEELFLSSTYIAPNPTSSMIEIMGNLEGFENVAYEILDINGKKVLAGEVIEGQKIDTEYLISGIYTIRLVADNSHKTLKLVKL